jgi:EmrB/QacA subfamily drug resistance transporter
MSTTPATPPEASDSSSPAAVGVPAQGAPPADEGLDRELLLVASVVVLGAVMSILDVTVVNVAIPALVAEFDTTLSTIQWVATGYTLALATVIPLSAWGADRFGTKRLYMASIAMFVGGSLLSGLAWSEGSLIAFRILQGFGGGLIMPLGMTIMTRAAGPQRVGRVMAVMGVPMLLGPVFGPILGGWLVDDFSWRWIFFINLPIGLFALFLASRVLPRDVPDADHRLDWLGLVLLSPSLAALIYGLANTASETDANGQQTGGGFGQAIVLVPMILGALGLASFVAHALRSRAPLIDLRLFRNRVFTASTVTLMLMVISVFGGMLLMPVYLSSVRFESAMDIGLLLAPQGLGAMLGMPIAGRLTDKTGVGRIVPFGLLAIGTSFLLLTQIEADTSYWQFGAVLVLQGIGMGFAMMPLFSGAMQTLRRSQIANASTALNIMQQVSASVGTAVLSVILTNEIVERVTAATAAAQSSGQPQQQLSEAERAQALAPVIAPAFGATFWWAVGLVAVAFVVALVLLPKRKPEPVEDDESDDAPVAMVMG